MNSATTSSAVQGSSGSATRVVTAALLIGCGTIFLPAGAMFTGRTFWGWPASGTYIAWERGFVIAAVLVSVGGFALLEHLLREAGEAILPRLAFVTYLVGAVVLISAEAAFIDNRAFVNSQLVLFIVLACLAQASYGLALVLSGLVTAWAGWATIAWNVGALALLALLSPRNMYYPAVHVVAPVILGVALLARRPHP